VAFTHDGYVGDGGKYFSYVLSYPTLLFIVNVDIQSKIERATHVDINNDDDTY